MSRDFSKRYGYGTADAEITVREDAPDDLRYAVAEIHGLRDEPELDPQHRLPGPVRRPRPQQLVGISERLRKS